MAVLTISAGVAGGLYLDEDRAAQTSAANVGLYLQAEQAEQQLLKDRQAEWIKLTAQQRALQAAARARAEAEAKAAAARAKAVETEASRRGAGRTVTFGPIPASCNVYSGNKAIGCALVLSAGFGLDQMPCLDKLWTKESGWNHRALNKGSGAYGIPQSLPGDKMAKFGADWRTNPATQIKWGLSYIEGRYGTPCKAWQHSINVGWY